MKKASKLNEKALIAFCLASKNFGLVIIFSQMKHKHTHEVKNKTTTAILKEIKTKDTFKMNAF